MKTYEVSREAAKQLFIRILYGGSFGVWVNENSLNHAQELSFPKTFKKELDGICKIIVANNPELNNVVEEQGDKHNVDASVCAHILQ